MAHIEGGGRWRRLGIYHSSKVGSVAHQLIRPPSSEGKVGGGRRRRPHEQSSWVGVPVEALPDTSAHVNPFLDDLETKPTCVFNAYLESFFNFTVEHKHLLLVIF